MIKDLRAFFLPADIGARFVLFLPAQGNSPKGSVLYVHPFAEEMNKARRMAALQARAFAAAGYNVMLLDLYGSGDSAGNFSDARWDIWKRDLSVATQWLKAEGEQPIYLWGLRLGALLGLDYWRSQPSLFAAAFLWQPVASGETFMTQFLRLAVAGEALRNSSSGVSTNSLRNKLKEHHSIEVAGYELSPELVGAIESCKLADCYISGGTIYWLDVRNNNEVPIATQRILDKWREQDINIDYRAVPGDAFWATQEIAEVPALITETLSCLDKTYDKF